MMVNPILVPLIILAAVALWFLLAFLFKPLGRFFYRIWKDAIDEIKEEENEKNE